MWTTELRQHCANNAKCNELDWVCVPLVVEFYELEERRLWSLYLPAGILISHLKAKSVVFAELYGRLNLHLVQANAIAILSRV